MGAPQTEGELFVQHIRIATSLGAKAVQDHSAQDGSAVFFICEPSANGLRPRCSRQVVEAAAWTAYIDGGYGFRSHRFTEEPKYVLGMMHILRVRYGGFDLRAEDQRPLLTHWRSVTCKMVRGPGGEGIAAYGEEIGVAIGWALVAAIENQECLHDAPALSVLAEAFFQL